MANFRNELTIPASVQSAIKGYREAFYPPDKSPTPPASPALTPPPDELDVDEGGSGDGQRADGTTPQRGLLFDEGEDGEGPDDDELRSMDEMERTDAGDKEDGRAAPPVLEEEDEWEGLYD